VQYVGRSRRLRTRIGEHGNAGGGRYNATFAYKLAKRSAPKYITKEKTRRELDESKLFKPYFDAAKLRVSRMNLHVVEIGDPMTRAVFELYAQIALGPEFNDPTES